MPEIERLQPSTWSAEGESVSLNASYCSECNQYYFPPVNICSGCHQHNLPQEPVSEMGTLYSYTTIHVPRPGYVVPYSVGFIDFPDRNLRVFGRLTTNGPFQLGMQVRLTSGILHNHDGVSIESYMFEPLGVNVND